MNELTSNSSSVYIINQFFNLCSLESAERDFMLRFSSSSRSGYLLIAQNSHQLVEASNISILCCFINSIYEYPSGWYYCVEMEMILCRVFYVSFELIPCFKLRQQALPLAFNVLIQAWRRLKIKVEYLQRTIY